MLEPAEKGGRPDLHAHVLAGELTANAAERQMREQEDLQKTQAGREAGNFQAQHATPIYEAL